MALQTLLDSMKLIDPKATLLYRDERCEWVRSALAIVGKIQVATGDKDTSPRTLSSSLTKLISHAYSVLDTLPDEQLSFEDLWNLLLLISVPWTRPEVRDRADIVNILSAFATDISGSRKLILWADTSLERYLGSLGSGAGSWVPPSGDPLRDTVMEFARNKTERKVFELLFKRRLADQDIDDLIRVLSRRGKA